MGAEDVRRQALNVFRIQMLGAKVNHIPRCFFSVTEYEIAGNPRSLRVTHSERCGERGHAGLGDKSLHNPLPRRLGHRPSSFPDSRPRFSKSDWPRNQVTTTRNHGKTA
jgi:hypothetical protein